MNKIFRRQFWLVTGFFKKYHRIIIGSLVASVIIGFLGIKLTQVLPRPKQILRIAIIGQYTSQTLPPIVKNLLNSGLTKIGPNSTVIGNLADNWQVVDEGKTYIFNLKPNLIWSNGAQLKAKDIQINIPNVKSEINGASQIIFHLPEVFAPFPSALTNPVTNDKGLTPSPYKVSLTQNTNGVITSFDLQNASQEILIKVYPNTNQSFTAYKLGEVDAIYNYLPSSDISVTNFGTSSATNNFNQALVIFFNTQNPALKDKSIRQGIAYAIKDKSFGMSRSLTPISTQSWAYNPLVKTYDYDPDKAGKLITAALPDKTKILNLELATMPQYLDVAEKIKSELDSNLINLTIKVVTTRPENYQLYLTLFDIPPDPDQYIFWHSTQNTNISHFNNEKIDKALEDGRRTLDDQERKRIYNEFQRTFAEELPALFLYYPQYLNLARKEAIFTQVKPDLAL